MFLYRFGTCPGKSSIPARGGKSPHVLYSSRSVDTYAKKRLKVELLIKPFIANKSNKVQAIKCSQSIAVESFPLKDLSV